MLSVNLLPGADSAASAIQAEKVRMEVISQNIANANTTEHTARRSVSAPGGAVRDGDEKSV